MRIFRRRKLHPRHRTVRGPQRAHYLRHKEAARRIIVSRLHHHNAHYGFVWGRVAIKAQRSRWGSCSSLGNLNFNYRILFLPPHLQDYIIVHELCHLAELNHGPRFWALVAERCPEYRAHQKELRTYEGYAAAADSRAPAASSATRVCVP